jgi:NADH-quinone oxidoreductase subunit L
MGNLERYMPATAKTYLISTLAISGIFPLSGFFSKDEILFKSFEYGYNGEVWAYFVWVVGLVTAVLTAIYMTRSYILTFKGTERWPLADRIHPHESPSSMTVPLWILAVLAAVGGFVGIPAVIQHGDLNWIHHWLGAAYGGPVAEPAPHEHVAGFVAIEWGLLILGLLIGLFGVWFGWTRYTRHGLAYDGILENRLGGVYRLWRGKYYLDELYDRTIVQPVLNLSYKVLRPFDQGVVDGTVNGVASVTRGAGWLLRYLQDGKVQHYASAMLLGVAVVIALLVFAR